MIVDFIGMQIYKLRNSPFDHPIWEDTNVLDFILKSFYTIKESKVLDIGCGQGGLALKLAQLGANVEAIDISLNQLSLAKVKKHSLGLQNIRFRNLNGTKQLPYPSKHFDIVILYHVYEHLSNRNKLLINIHRILRRDGKLIVAVPLITALKKKISKVGICSYSHPTHKTEFTYALLLSELNKARFIIVNSQLYGFDPLIQNLLTPIFAVLPKQVGKINTIMRNLLEPANVICSMKTEPDNY
jgi:2-polyprenyl-3-methyl-5-hydroxy-6-metoxy-1,4-benzoquinol methylase